MGACGEQSGAVLWKDDALIVTEMNEDACAEIAEWKYGGEHALYDFEGIGTEREQLFNGLHFAVYFTADYAETVKQAAERAAERAAEKAGLSCGAEDRIFGGQLPCGFLSFGPAAQVMSRASKRFYRDERYTDIGLGLHPQLCGLRVGLGDRLVRAAVQYAKQEFPEDGVRLTVLKQNRRAVTVYARNGFSVAGTFLCRVTVCGRHFLRRFLLMQTGETGRTETKSK